MRLPDDVFETLKAERAKYGAVPNDRELGLLLNATAYAHRGQGFGLSRKDGGAHAPFPGGNPEYIAHDIIMLSDGTAWDCLIAAGAEAKPIQGESFMVTDPNRGWVRPVPVDAPPESPAPPPVPPAPDLSAVLAKLDRAIAFLDVIAVQNARVELCARGAESAAITAKLAAQGALEQATQAKLAAQSAVLKPAPKYIGKLWGATVVLRPEP